MQIGIALLGMACLVPVCRADEFTQARGRVRRLEECATLLDRFPNRLGSYQCYWLEGRRQGRLTEARSMLEARLREHPDDQRARLYLGYLMVDLNAPEAEATLREAAEKLRSAEDGHAEIAALMMLNFFVRSHGDLAAAQPLLDRAEQVASDLGDEVELAQVRIEQGMNAYYRRDYTRAWTTFQQLEAGLNDKTARLTAKIYAGLSAAASALGRHREAFDYRKREVDFYHRAGNAGAEAEALAHLTGAAQQVVEPRPYRPEELLGFARDAYDAAVRVKSPIFIANAHGLLADCTSLSATERLAHREQALEGFRKLKFSGGILKSLVGLAALYAELGLEPKSVAYASLEEAIDLARKAGREEYVALAWRVRAKLRWLTGTPEEAAADSGAAIEATEAIFDPIQSPQVHLEALGRFAGEYRLLSGAILRYGPSDRARGTELAFRIIELIRARMLLVRQATASKARRAPDDPVRSGLLARKVELQRRLLDPRLGSAERADKLTALAELENELLAADQTEDRGLSSRQVDRSIARLDQVQAALRPGQAILAYQLADKTLLGPPGQDGPVEAGGSWLMAISHDALAAKPLPDRKQLEGRVQLFLGLLDRRDGAEDQGARLLYSDLVGPALEGLPAGTRELIIVPDGVLHRLPFAALRAADGRALIESHEVAVAPSVSMWWRWRQTKVQSHPRSVLALSNPVLSAKAGADPSRAADIFRSGIDLGRLPYATEEARDLSQRLGGEPEWLWDGAQASESRLKAASLGQFALLHLAAHAVVDEDAPLRSAVVLAPGAEGEDGLLQPAEIAALDLQGAAILLSSCRATGGALQEGEGIMSLSRAFFLGGARAVIGNLWSLRDDEARQFFSAVAEELAGGLSIGRALAATQRAWLAEGRPSADWAGFELQGDLDLVPFPGGISRSLSRRELLLILGGLGLVLLAAGAVLLRRRAKAVAGRAT